MALDVLLIKKPFEIAWSGNDMVFTFAISPYGVPEEARNLKLRLQVQVEAVFNSGLFGDVHTAVTAPCKQGMVYINVNTIVDAYLKYFVPPVINNQIIECPEQTKRYRIVYTLVDDVSVVVPAQTSAALFAIKGGMAKEFSNHVEYFSSYNHLLTPLYLAGGQGGYVGGTDSDLYQKGETRFLYMLSRQDITLSAATPVFVNAIDKTGAFQMVHNFTIASITRYRVYCIPVSPQQLFPAINEDTLGYIAIALQALGSRVVTLRVDHRKWYETHQLVYRNSTGGLDTITLRGQVDYEADYTRQQAEQSPFPDRFLDGVLIAEQTTASVSEQYKLKGDTGFITRERLQALRDMFLSMECYEVVKGKLLPIIINVKNAKLYTNKTRLYAAQVEWQHALDNEFFTPEYLGIATATCPAVEQLMVRQLNSRKIEIMWSLRIPYHQLQVEVDVQGTIQLLTLSGNTGKVEHTITITGSAAVDIYIRARTICNPYTTPMDMGPWRMLTLNVLANRPPVATWDLFTVPQGVTSPYSIPVSVMVNDYDPDGDPIEVVPNSGICAFAGGQFTINSAGMITYLPPTSVYTGNDVIDYYLLEPGSGIQIFARVILIVGSGGTGGSNVFVKLVERNVVTVTSGNNTTTRGERWLDFFSDPGGTTPLDITGRNITINYREQRVTVGGSTSGDYNQVKAVLGTGIRIRIYIGDFTVRAPNILIYNFYTTTTTHTILAGTGYTGI